MKKFLLTLTLLLLTNNAWASVMYAKAAGGNWSAAGTWSATGSDGVDSVGPPTASTNVIFEQGSGNVDIDAAAACRSIDMTAGLRDYAGLLTLKTLITISIGDATAGVGNVALKLVAGTFTRESSSLVKFVSTSATLQTITPVGIGGGTNWGNVTFDGVGGNWAITAGMTFSTTATLTLTNGTLHLDGVSDNSGLTHSIGFFLAPSGTRTLVGGTANITITGSTDALWGWTTQSSASLGFTHSGTITFTGSAIGRLFNLASSITFNNVVISGTGAARISIGSAQALVFNNLTRTGGGSDGLSFDPITTASITINGTLTVTGSSAGQRVFVRVTEGLVGPTLITAAAVALTNVDFQGITAGGAVPWTGTVMGNALGNTNITFDTPVTRYAVAAGNWSSTATWSATDGGASGATVPLPQDTVYINNNSGVGTITIDTQNLGADLDFNGGGGGTKYTGTWAMSQASNMYGSLTLSSGMTISGTQNFSLSGRSNHTLTMSGKTIFSNTTIYGGTYTQADAAAFNNTLAHSSGTYLTNNLPLTCSTFQSISGNTRVFNGGTSTINVTRVAGGTPWNVTATGLTLSAASTTIVFAVASSAHTFAGGGQVYGTVTHNVAGAAFGLIITGANTFNTLNFSNASNADTLTLPASTTTTILNNFNVYGTSGKLISIVSSTGGTQATLSKASGNVVSDYLSIQDSAATGGAGWSAGTNSTNVSGNSGWKFTAPVVTILNDFTGNNFAITNN